MFVNQFEKQTGQKTEPFVHLHVTDHVDVNSFLFFHCQSLNQDDPRPNGIVISFFFLPFFAYFCCLFFCLFFVYFFFCRFFKCSEWFRPFVSVGLRCARALSVGSIWRLNLAATAPDRRATPCRFPLLPGRLGACSPARSNFWRFPLFGGHLGACSCSEQFLAFSTVRRVSRGLLLIGAVFGVFH